MQQALRPYATAGVALVGAGLIAITPVAAQMPGIGQLNQGVQLTSSALAAAADSLNTLIDTQLQSLVDNLQTSLGATGTALGDLGTALSDPSTAVDNLQTAFDALTFLGGDQKTFLTPVSNFTLDSSHALLFNVLTNGLNIPGIADIPALSGTSLDLVNFISSPLSGDLFGLVSPLVAPIVPFLNPIMELLADSQNNVTPDVAALGQELLQAPVQSIFALFNGATLDLDPVIPTVESSGLIPLPEGVDLNHLSLAFGGLFTPGETVSGPGSDSAADPAIVGAGGSIFNALGLDLTGLPAIGTLDVPGTAVGPIGAHAGLIEVLAQALQGNLPPLEPPPADATDPTSFLSSLFSGGGVENLFQELLNGSGLEGLFQGLLDDLGLDQVGSDAAAEAAASLF